MSVRKHEINYYNKNDVQLKTICVWKQKAMKLWCCAGGPPSITIIITIRISVLTGGSNRMTEEKILLNVQSIPQLKFEIIKMKFVVVCCKARKNSNTTVNQFKLNYYIHDVWERRGPYCAVSAQFMNFEDMHLIRNMDVKYTFEFGADKYCINKNWPINPL